MRNESGEINKTLQKKEIKNPRDYSEQSRVYQLHIRQNEQTPTNIKKQAMGMAQYEKRN
jgi:Zn-finger nucleic acid-binding protein